MIDFTTVAGEFRSLVHRRRAMMTFLGSLFAASSLFLQNHLQGNLPPALARIQDHGFVFYALMLMAPCLVLALRLARLHAGMVLTGMLYARLMQEQNWTKPQDIDRASRHNWFGVSFIQSQLTGLIAAFSASLLTLALTDQPRTAALVGVGVFGVLLFF